jgi:SAM-dependent methyltransferase
MEIDLERQTHAVEDWHWWYVGRRRVLHQVLRAMHLPPGAAILDAGCGSGRNLVEFAKFGPVTGLEPAPESLELARARGVGTVVSGSFDEPLPFADSTFALATVLDVIEHLDDDVGALRELRRVVAPDGRLLVTVPCYPWLWSSHDVVNHHRRRYTRRTLHRAARAAGWEPERTLHFNMLLLPAAAATRLAQRFGRSASGVSDLERTPRALNQVLRQPLHLESWLIGAGINPPLGLSLLCVLRPAA